MERTPKWTGKTWGDWVGRRSGSWTLRGGWEGGGVPTPGGTLVVLEQGWACPVIPLPNQPRKSAWLSSLGPQRSPLGWVGPGGLGGRPGEASRRDPPGWEEQEGSGGGLPHPRRPREPAGHTGGVPCPLRPKAGGTPGSLLFCWA